MFPIFAVLLGTRPISNIRVIVKHLNIQIMENINTTTAQRYVDILTNGGFKALFGDINNKDVVMSILNVLLPEHRRLADIEYLPTERQGTLLDINKDYQYDFMCKDLSGAVFIVELQRYREVHWFKRCVSYACRAYDRQNRKGEEYDIPPVYLIGLMDVEVEHPDKEYWKERYVSEYTFREKTCYDLLGETIVIIFAEMANFHKRLEDCESETDKMLYVLKNIGKMMNQPAWLQHEVYSRIFQACEIVGFPEDKRIEYEQEMYDERRRRGEIKAARLDGFDEGHKEGLAEGEAKGSDSAKRDIVMSMISKGLSVEQIAEFTGIDIESVKQIVS